jgi:hypothetical protein
MTSQAPSEYAALLNNTLSELFEYFLAELPAL